MTNDDPALMSALTTEHFVLQTAISTATSEESARATLYVMALSSSLVALGFAAPPSPAFAPLAATLLPALAILGLLTAAVHLVLFYLYQRRRYRTRPQLPELSPGPQQPERLRVSHRPGHFLGGSRSGGPVADSMPSSREPRQWRVLPVGRLNRCTA
ncbi:hypothetical protein ACFQQB_35845 [Nonomuraea rubra]|uniref:hypothetical protein n=1 Tax=Nonomuraea rubra TaxID=46180 RepID=UPI00360E3FA1